MYWKIDWNRFNKIWDFEAIDSHLWIYYIHTKKSKRGRPLLNEIPVSRGKKEVVHILHTWYKAPWGRRSSLGKEAYQRDHLEEKEKYTSFKTPSDYLKSQEDENLQMTILVVSYAESSWKQEELIPNKKKQKLCSFLFQGSFVPPYWVPTTLNSI